MTGILLIILHIAVCIVCYMLRKIGKWHRDENLMPIVIGVPFFGIICHIVYELVYATHLNERHIDDIERLEVNDIKYKKIEVEQNKQQDIVPLEEAFLMDDTMLRRQMMLEILHKNPNEYVNMLQKAKMSDDTEVIHYATTMMMEIMTEHEKRLQICEKAYREEPDSKEVLSEYIKAYLEFMETGLVSGALVQIYTEQIAELLSEYYNKFGITRKFLFAEIKTLLYLKNYKLAQERLELAKQRYVNEAEVYKLYGELYYEQKDYEGLKRMVEKIKKEDIYLDRDSKDWLEFWDEKGQERI